MIARFLEPRDLDEACRTLAGDEWGAKVISGGTALVLMMRQGLVVPSTLVSIGQFDALRGIRRNGSSMWIGSRTTHTAIATSANMLTWLPSLAEACRSVGNIRIRNVGTIGGNLAEADYASDPPTVLVGLDAVCHVIGPEGERQVPVADLATGFYATSLQPGEIITGLSVLLDPNRVYAYEKYVSRSSEDRPCVGVATMARFDGNRLERLSVVVGAVAPVPQRFEQITEQAVGTSLDDRVRRDIARAIADAIDPIEDGRGSAWYRRRITAVLVRRALERVSQ
jgi:carbon-monoxide dehydrogenase medium subunit